MVCGGHVRRETCTALRLITGDRLEGPLALSSSPSLSRPSFLSSPVCPSAGPRGENAEARRRRAESRRANGTAVSFSWRERRTGGTGIRGRISRDRIHVHTCTHTRKSVLPGAHTVSPRCSSSLLSRARRKSNPARSSFLRCERSVTRVRARTSFRFGSSRSECYVPRGRPSADPRRRDRAIGDRCGSRACYPPRGTCFATNRRSGGEAPGIRIRANGSQRRIRRCSSGGEIPEGRGGSFRGEESGNVTAARLSAHFPASKLAPPSLEGVRFTTERRQNGR